MASHNALVQDPNLHVFEYRNIAYAFDPVSLRLAELNRREAEFLHAYEEARERHEADLLLGQKPQRAAEVVSSLSCKGINLASPHHRAPVNPPVDQVEIIVNSAQDCNLACQYCFVNRGEFAYGKDRAHRLSSDHARRLVEVLPDAFPWARQFCIHFYGGEPLLNLRAIRSAVDAAASTNDSRFAFSITTNGTMGSEDAFSVLRKGRFSVVLSIDGPPEIHNSVRPTSSGRPTHDKVLKFLQQLKVEHLFVRGSSVVRRGWSLREALAYLSTLPVDAVKAQAVRLPPGHPLSLTEDERSQYLEHLRESADEVVDCLNRGEIPKDDRFNHRVLQLLAGTRRTRFCGAGRWIFGMAADGTVLPCVLLAGKEGTSLGSIDGPPGTWVERGRVWSKGRGPRGECRRCWALPLCGGGCPAMTSVCGEDECELVRKNCEMALAIYGSFLDRPEDLLLLAGLR